MLVWLSVWSVVQMFCIWFSWCHCYPIISCFSKIQNGSVFLVLAYPGCLAKEAVKWELMTKIYYIRHVANSCIKMHEIWFNMKLEVSKCDCLNTCITSHRWTVWHCLTPTDHQIVHKAGSTTEVWDDDGSGKLTRCNDVKQERLNALEVWLSQGWQNET